MTVALIATHLDPEEQGFYFTFNSIIALQALVDLGMVSVIQQFASHERAFLEWLPDGTLGGVPLHKGRLASVVRTALRWYGVGAILLVAVLLSVGTLFLSLRASGTFAWRGQWIAVALFASAALMLTPALAAIEGCGKVATIARVRTFQSVASSLAIWAVLLLGGRLWAPVAAAAATFVIAAVHLLRRWRPFLTDLLHTPDGDLSWREEVWPFQWRTALSWMSSYFIFQMFTPLAFALSGPAAAGRMGLTLSVANMILSMAMVWLWAKRPLFAVTVARREFATLDALFFPATLRALAVMIAGSTAFVAGMFVLGAIGHPWRARFLAPTPLILLVLAMLATQLHWAQATYLRAHKQEPMLGVRIVAAILTVASAIVFGERWGTTGMMVGFLAVTVVVPLTAGTLVFIRKRREWHA